MLAMVLVKIVLLYIVTEVNMLIFIHMCQENQNQVNFTDFNLILNLSWFLIFLSLLVLPVLH